MTPKISEQQFLQWLVLLNGIAEKILMNVSLEDLTTSIMSAIQTHLKSFGGVILLIDEENKNLKLHSFSRLPLIKKALQLVPQNIFGIKYPLDIPDLLIAEPVKRNNIVQSEHLRDFFYPVFKPAKLLDTIQKILGVKMCIGIPIRIQGIVRGVFFIAAQEKNISETQYITMQFFANLSGLALENKLKLDEIRERYEMEKETTSILSHELKTPIAIAHHSAQTILMTLEKYKDSVDKKSIAELLKTARDVQHGMDRLARICTSIFNLREVENRVPRDIHLIDLKKQCGQILYTHERKAHEKGLDFKFQLEENKNKYHGAIIQLEQIMTILLDNAVKYTEKGRITVESRFRNKKLICTVTDTGIGIPEHQRHLVFNRFYRNPKRGKINQIEGLGLGLYIAQKIIKEIKGSIEIDQNPEGRGTRFTVKIPLYSRRTS
jgi:signal transduction histidine kinase